MLVVDCCDDCPWPKATNRCLPGANNNIGADTVSQILSELNRFAHSLDRV